MKNIICEESVALGRAASNWCREKKIKYAATSAFVPAGRTPMALYDVWRTERPDYLTGMRLLQIDDVLTGREAGVFKRFFADHLPEYQNQIELITDASAGADLAILGLGLNGHVAFHEPGVDDTFYSGCVRLTETTCDHLGLERGTWGISYGAAAFSRAKAVLLMVSGSSKCDILARLIDRDPRLPATSLLAHCDFTILADPDALRRIDLRSGGRKLEFDGVA